MMNKPFIHYHDTRVGNHIIEIDAAILKEKLKNGEIKLQVKYEQRIKKYLKI